MSQAGSQAWAFYREVAKTRVVWTVADDKGIPWPMTSSGVRAMPLWSSRSRVERIINACPAYGGFEPYEISWDEFCREWLPDLNNNKALVGVNWSGKRAKGYDIEPDRLRQSVEAMIENPQ